MKLLANLMSFVAQGPSALPVVFRRQPTQEYETFTPEYEYGVKVPKKRKWTRYLFLSITVMAIIGWGVYHVASTPSAKTLAKQAKMAEHKAMVDAIRKSVTEDPKGATKEELDILKEDQKQEARELALRNKEFEASQLSYFERWEKNKEVAMVNDWLAFLLQGLFLFPALVVGLLIALIRKRTWRKRYIRSEKVVIEVKAERNQTLAKKDEKILLLNHTIEEMKKPEQQYIDAYDRVQAARDLVPGFCNKEPDWEHIYETVEAFAALLEIAAKELPDSEVWSPPPELASRLPDWDLLIWMGHHAEWNLERGAQGAFNAAGQTLVAMDSIRSPTVWREHFNHYHACVDVGMDFIGKMQRDGIQVFFKTYVARDIHLGIRHALSEQLARLPGDQIPTSRLKVSAAALIEGHERFREAAAAGRLQIETPLGEAIVSEVERVSEPAQEEGHPPLRLQLVPKQQEA